MLGCLRSRAFLAALIVACGEPIAPSDAGRDVSFGVLPMLGGSLGCVGLPTAPVAEAPLDSSISVIPFGSTSPVLDLDLWLFPGDRVAAECVAPECLLLRPDATARVPVRLAGGAWVAVRYFPDDAAVLPGIVVHQRAPLAPSNSGVPALDRTTIETLVGILRPTLEVDFARGLIGARVTDCDGAFVSGAVIRVFVRGEEVVDGVDGALIGYFDTGDVPDRDARYTSEGGLVGMLNIPVPESLVQARLEAWGVLSSGAVPQRIACETVPIERGTLSVVGLAPLRADYASDDECP